MPPKGWRKNRNAKNGAEQWIKTPSSTTTKTVTIISKSPSHSIWDAFWPNFDKRRKARDTVKITGTYNPDTKTLDGTWSFLNRASKKRNPFSYKRTENERDSMSQRHPAVHNQDMRRLFADVHTSQTGFYNVKTLSPIFHGVEAGVKTATNNLNNNNSTNADDEQDIDNAIHGFWDGIFDLMLPTKKSIVKCEETFEIRTNFGPSSLQRNYKSSSTNSNNNNDDDGDTNKDEIPFVGRGENDFGIFTMQGTYNKSTYEFNAIKMYDPPIVKKRPRSDSNAIQSSSSNQIGSSSDGRTSKRQRKVSQIIRLREQQALAAKKAEEDAIVEKKKRIAERKILKARRREQEQMAAEERETRRLLQEKQKILDAKIKAEKLRLKKIADEERRVEMERKRQEQERINAEKKALRIKKMEEEIQARKIKQQQLREAALRKAAVRRQQQKQQQQAQSSFHPMSPLNVSLNTQYNANGSNGSSNRNNNNNRNNGNNNTMRLRGENTLHALIMQQQRQRQQGLRVGPISPIYTGNLGKTFMKRRGPGRPSQFHGNQYTTGRRGRPQRQPAPEPEIIEEIESDEDLDLPEGVPQVVATVYRKLDKNGKPIEGEPEFRTALSYPNGEIYEGQFLNGMRHGLGTCIYVNGDMYEGEWSEGLCHGEGLISNEKGKLVCQGEFLEGRLNGNAVFKHEDGSQYTGEWKESRRHGRGKYVDKDGNKYEGEWKDNVRQGHGIHVGINGSYFDGEWARDVRNGFGYLKLANGTEYEGTWKSNRMEGRGVIKYPDGGRYEGNVRLGKKDGRGKYVFPSGAEYEGRFRDDKIDGMGTLRMDGGVSSVKKKKNDDEEDYIEEEKKQKEEKDSGNSSSSDSDDDDKGPKEILSKEDIEDEEIMIPFDLQKDLAAIHFVAGFNRFGK